MTEESIVPGKEEFLTVEEAATFLRVKPDTLYSWVHKERIPFRKHGSRLVFSKRDLELWSKAQAVPAKES